jgi:xanthine dehydrogenase YagS FAD-binding subunit
MRAFRHHHAHTLDEVFSLLDAYEGRARLIAGGTDLLGILKDELLPDYPEALISIKTLPGLEGIEEEAGAIRIGALTRLTQLVQSPVIRNKAPALAEAAKSVATPEIRNMGTLGGNLCQDTRCWYYRYPHQMGGRIVCHRKGKGPCHAVKGDNRYQAILGGKGCFAVCPSDTAIALAALDAEVVVTGREGKKVLPIQDFYQTLGNVLRPDEMMTEIRIRQIPGNTAQTFHKYRLREAIDFAVVSVASVITMDKGTCKNVRIVLGAVAPTPFRATAAEDTVRGKPLTEKLAQEAAEAAVGRAKPLSKNAYKVEVAKTLVKRALLSTLR